MSENKFVTQATKPVVFCHGGPSKLTNYVTTNFVEKHSLTRAHPRTGTKVLMRGTVGWGSQTGNHSGWLFLKPAGEGSVPGLSLGLVDGHVLPVSSHITFSPYVSLCLNFPFF